MTKVLANARQRTTELVIWSTEAAFSWCWGVIGGEVVALGDAGGDELLAAAAVGADEDGADASVSATAAVASATAAADVSASPSAPPDGATGSFFGVSSLPVTPMKRF